MAACLFLNGKSVFEKRVFGRRSVLMGKVGVTVGWGEINNQELCKILAGNK